MTKSFELPSSRKTFVPVESIPSAKRTKFGGAQLISRDQKLNFGKQKLFIQHDFRKLIELVCPKSKNPQCEINYRGYTGENCVEIASGIKPNNYVDSSVNVTLKV